jgi:putative ABC transport system substrate-binding protein
MKRRQFIAALGSAGVVAGYRPRAMLAQQSALPVIGFLTTRTAADSAKLVTAFRKGLEETGFSESRNLSVDYRFADGRLDQLPEMAADLVRRPLAVLVTAGGAPSAVAAAKRILRNVYGRQPGDVMDLTVDASAAQRVSLEGQEGMKAFLQKRRPTWE